MAHTYEGSPLLPRPHEKPRGALQLKGFTGLGVGVWGLGFCELVAGFRVSGGV